MAALDRIAEQALLESMAFFPVIGIIGPRQVGKTTISKALTAGLEKRSVYLDLENPADLAKLTDPVLFFSDHEDACIILDEIQREPDLFPVLRSMIDRRREPNRFILLGSASPALLRDSSESLAGRISYVELNPFNLLEVETTDWKRHWFRGGFPDAYLANSDRMAVRWHQQFRRSYIERDLPQLGLNLDPQTGHKFWMMLAHSHGNLVNHSAIGRSLGTSSTTIKKYLNFLEQAFIIRQLQPYSVNIGKRLVKSPKLYYRDSGMLHQLMALNTYNQLSAHPVIGASWESYVIEQICQLLNDDKQVFFYRSHQGAECDLVICEGGRVIYAIEVKYSSAPRLTKGLFQAFEDLQSPRQIVVCPTNERYRLHENVEVVGLADLLKELLDANWSN